MVNIPAREFLNADCPIVKISICCNNLLFQTINYMCIAICDYHFACDHKLKSFFFLFLLIEIYKWMHI